MLNKKRIQKLLLALGICFIVLLIVKSSDTLVRLFFQVRWSLFVLSILLALIGNFLLSHLYQKLLNKYDVKVSYHQALEIFFYAQIAKYIPGKIWSIWYQTTHINLPNTTWPIIFTNLDLMFVLLFAVTAYALYLSLILSGAAIFAFTIFLLSIGIFFALLRSALLSVFARKIKALKEHIPANTNNVSFLFSIYFYSIFFISYIGSHYWMLQAVFCLEQIDTLVYVICISLAWVIGVITIVSPGGIGVREAAFIFLGMYFGTEISLEMLASIALVSRLWMICQEIIGALLLFVYIRWVAR